jgi:hypothetical protein
LWNGTPIAIQVNRLNQDGTLDAAFNYNLKADGNLVTLALQADGKILFGGGFTSFAGQTRNNLGRLNADGSIDTAFFPTVNSNVQALVLQPDGAVLVGGLFSNISGQLRNGFARLTPSDPGAQYLSCDGQTITWLRCGTTPEVWRTTFETSSDGTNWTTVGAGFRVSGGWQLTGLSLPANTLLRARGFATGAYYQGSGWYVESLAHVLSPPPSILTNDAVFGFRPDHFGFSLSAVPGQALVIEASTDLVHWLPIQTNLVPVPSQAAMPGNSGVLQAGTGLVAFTDSQASLASKRFYRALLYSPRWTQ